MATGHFYGNHSTVGNPGINQAAGSLITFLDWMLDIAGGVHWEKPFSGTNIAVYRATTGRRDFLRVDDSNAGAARVRIYQDMTDVDTGTGRAPHTTHGIGYITWPKRDTTGNSNHVFVRDSRFFMILCGFDPTYYTHIAPMIFGEPEVLDSLDSYGSILCGVYSSALPPVANAFYDQEGILVGTKVLGHGERISDIDPNTTSNVAVASIDGVNAGVALCSFSGVLTATTASNVLGFINFSSSPNVVLFPMYLASLESNDGAALNDTSSFSLIRFRLPYLYRTPFKFNTGINWFDTVTDGSGSTFTCMYGGNATSATYLDTFIFLMRSSNDEPGRP